MQMSGVGKCQTTHCPLRCTIDHLPKATWLENLFDSMPGVKEVRVWQGNVYVGGSERDDAARAFVAVISLVLNVVSVDSGPVGSHGEVEVIEVSVRLEAKGDCISRLVEGSGVNLAFQGREVSVEGPPNGGLVPRLVEGHRHVSREQAYTGYPGM